MKNLLFIDTADGTRACLRFNGKIYYDENDVNAGSEILLPLIDGLLKRADCRLNDVDVFGACVGPGSFTGLRIGLTTVKTFCYALNKPCFAVNNLRLNSYNNDSEKVISIADAGNKVCYIAMYDGEKEVESPHCVTREQAELFVASHKDYGVSTDKKLSTLFSNGKCGVGERELLVAIEKFENAIIPENELLPLYVRKPQPERGEGDL